MSEELPESEAAALIDDLLEVRSVDETTLEEIEDLRDAGDVFEALEVLLEAL